jgi:hypothetical protein
VCIISVAWKNFACRISIEWRLFLDIYKLILEHILMPETTLLREAEPAGFETSAHALVMNAIAKLPGQQEDYAAGLADLRQATLQPDFDPAGAYDTITAVGRMLAQGGALNAARRLHHASIGIHARFPRDLDTESAAALAEAISRQTDYPLQDRPHNY